MCVVLCVRNKLDRLKLKDFYDTSVFFSKFEKTINKLKSAGGKVSEQEKLNYMLRTLPDSLSYVGDLIDSLKEEKRNCEFLKNKISFWELQNKSSIRKTKTSAFKTDGKSAVICHGCGKAGHYVKNCWHRGAGNSRPSRGTFWQGGGRHRPVSTPQQQSQQYRGGRRGRGGRGYSQRGNHGRGRDWHQRNNNNNSPGQHDARYGYAEYHYEDSGSFLTRIVNDGCNNKNNVETYACDSNKIDWILDSGCSDHIINNDSHYDEFINLKNPINVKIGDGSILKGTKVGKIHSYFIVNGREVRITISNVFSLKIWIKI